MKKLQILENIVNFIWFMSMIGIIGIITYVVTYLYDPKIELSYKMAEINNFKNTEYPTLILFLKSASMLLYIYCVYLLRKIIKFFKKHEIFNIEVIKAFNLIGILIITAAIISSVSIYIYEKTFIGSPKTINLGLSPFIASVIGLLFMVISEVFKIAKNIKEENELTI